MVLIPGSSPLDALHRPVVRDLHADVPELHRGLLDAAGRGDPLDAFLYAAGIVQVGEDCLTGTSWLLSRAVAHLDGTGAGAVLRHALNGTVTASGLTSATRSLRAWLSPVRQLTDALADEVTARLPGGDTDRGGYGARAATLLERLGAEVPRPLMVLLDGCVLRAPSCFRSFDQHPRDVAELVTRFTRRYPDRDRALMVIGVRTSGAYLAPLAGAALRAEGYVRVQVRTTRPAGPAFRADTVELRSAARENALALLIDDPPITGGSLVGVARGLVRAGFPTERVVLLTAAFGDRPLPPLKPGFPLVVLPPQDWHIRERLRAGELRRTLAALLPDQVVLTVSADEPGLPSRWSRLEVPLTARVRSGAGDRDVRLVAQGAGTGYFGRHALAVADVLDGLVPPLQGFHDGVLLRERRPGEPDLLPDLAPTRQIPVDDVVRYVVQRRSRTPLPADRGPLLTGRQPIWEIAARLFAGRCGRLATPLRALLIDPLLRDLLHTPSASLVDGEMTRGRWWPGPDGWTKADFDEGHFSHLDLAAYDAAFDLAGAAQSQPEHTDRLLADYERLTGIRVSAARWCVYRAAHGWNAERLAHSGASAEPGEAEAGRARSRAFQEYLAGLYLDGLGATGDTDPAAQSPGRWCALDVDGVLESDLAGSPASSPAGMLALRGLRAHGYQVLPATGRSVPEVRDRCRAYGLRGGVAEYGAVVYDADRDRCVPLVTGPVRPALVRVLSGVPSVCVDPQFRYCVRASRGWGADRAALDSRTVRELAGSPQAAGFVVVQGETQTDFVPVGVDKATGFAALLGLLGAPAGARPVLAVGDSAPDIPLLRWARTGFAPGNAAPEVRAAAGVTVLRRPYQAGLADAVARLLGHAPGHCPLCRAPTLSPADAALTALLAVPEAGRAGMPVRLARLARARTAVTRPGSAPAAGWPAAAPGRQAGRLRARRSP
ncbi:HAD hydrolase family protein [Streptomyces sp. NPDC005574]|uniref:HAD hydrolase family protein n=1 Tax=Streptomyces sp. NPDC005574 TaxID=3156891 RepID=UPI0033AE648A